MKTNSTQATIRLSGDVHSLKDGVLYTWVFVGAPDNYQTMDEDEYMEALANAYAWKKSKYQVGATGVLVAYYDVSPNAIRDGRSDDPEYNLWFDCVGDGVPGNSNRNICRFHGWRGTTDDNYISAFGLRKIMAIRELKNGDFAVTVGKDLNPNSN